MRLMIPPPRSTTQSRCSAFLLNLAIRSAVDQRPPLQLVDFGLAKPFRQTEWLKTACGSPWCASRAMQQYELSQRKPWLHAIELETTRRQRAQYFLVVVKSPSESSSLLQERGPRGAGSEP